MKAYKFANSRGFTLIELMVTIMVVAILVALAAPNLTQMILNNRSEALGEELASALQVAKTEAVRRGQRVSVCPANDAGEACASDWTNGWLVFADSATSDGAANAVLASQDDIIRVFDAADDAAVISAVNDGSSVSFIRYTSTGQLARIGGQSNTAPVVVNAYVEKCKGEKQREITIGVAGMMDVDEVDCPASAAS